MRDGHRAGAAEPLAGAVPGGQAVPLGLRDAHAPHEQVFEERLGVPVMLVSNYPQYQQQAVDAGAVPGFGKAELRSPTTLARLAEFLG